MKRSGQILIASSLVAGFISWIAISAYQGMRFSPSQKKSAHSLAFACRSYAADYDGKYPDTKEQLDAEWGNELDVVWSPGGGIEFGLRGGLTESSPASSIVIYSLVPVRYGKHYVVRRDGSGEFLVWSAIAEEIELPESQQD